MTSKTALALCLRTAAKAPVHLYRYVMSPLLGPRCRHVPTCSQYALDAIDGNGAWAGLWLTVGRVARCHPWGTGGYDPAPNLSSMPISPFTPWRYMLEGYRRYKDA